MENDKLQQILSTEYSERFDKIRKNAMAMSYYRYGPMRENYNRNKTVDAIKSLEKRLDKYKETGNTEFLADIANFAMIEFMYPQHEQAHYKATDSSESPGLYGLGIFEIEEFKKNSY